MINCPSLLGELQRKIKAFCSMEASDKFRENSAKDENDWQ
jgi:hypothetical protein